MQPAADRLVDVSVGLRPDLCGVLTERPGNPRSYGRLFARPRGPLAGPRSRPLLALLAAVALALLAAVGARPAVAEPTPPGTRYEVTADSLPAPYATDSASARPDRVERPEGFLPLAPPGFEVTLFAGELVHPRWLAVAANGDVFLAEPEAGHVLLLRDADGDGSAETRAVFAAGFDRPHGLAFLPGWLLVADEEGVWRLPYRAGQLTPEGPAEPVTPPGAFGERGGHWTRNLALHPDGSRFYVAIGSMGNIAEEPVPRATVQEFRLDGSGQRTLAAGLRNPVGIAFYPGSSDLYVVVNERDGLGDGLVPDYLTRLVDGGFYGWPYAYIGSNPQPGYADRRPDLVAASLVPDLLFQSHTAPIGLVFYDGGQFPEDYRGDAFVALRGSWNAAVPRGYMVVRVPFADGRPQGHYEAFVTGFRLDAEGEPGDAEVWGRPAGLAVAADGSLLIADDTSGSVWRVAYED